MNVSVHHACFYVRARTYLGDSPGLSSPQNANTKLLACGRTIHA